METSTAVKDRGPAKPVSRFAIGVRLAGSSKSQLYDPENLVLKVGACVVVETSDGERLGTIASNKILNVNRNKPSLPRVLRQAGEKELAAAAKRDSFEVQAKVVCLEQILDLRLPMNLSRVVYQENTPKTTFYFTSEGRVDFRELVRALAAKLRTKIEMRQVGVRDEARNIGGYGVCGTSLCCSTFLKEFTPVTIRMAKDQGLALNPSKISGVCGRLMCCLQYEHDTYRAIMHMLPKPGSRVRTPDGAFGKALKNNIIEKKVMVLLEDDSIMHYHLDELRDFVPAGRRQEREEPAGNDNAEDLPG